MKYLTGLKRLIILGLFLTLMLAAVPAIAQESFTEADAIAAVLEDPTFTDGLAQVEGWTAAAYDTRNAYGIWRVQFWDGSGEDLAWADVNPARRKVYSFEAYFPVSEQVYEAAYTPLRAFVDSHPDLVELLGSPEAYDIYIDYDRWNRHWGVYIDAGADSLWIAVRFAGGASPEHGYFTDPRLVALYFSNVLSYSDWQESQKALATVTAHQHAEIGRALEGVIGWTTAAYAVDDNPNLWVVVFKDGERLIAEVTVDINASQIVDFTIHE
jgi:hypothetical protein